MNHMVLHWHSHLIANYSCESVFPNVTLFTRCHIPCLVFRRAGQWNVLHLIRVAEEPPHSAREKVNRIGPLTVCWFWLAAALNFLLLYRPQPQRAQHSQHPVCWRDGRNLQLGRRHPTWRPQVPIPNRWVWKAISVDVYQSQQFWSWNY